MKTPMTPPSEDGVRRASTMSVLTVDAVSRAVEQVGAKAAQGALDLGTAVLVGHIPAEDDGGPWSFRTKESPPPLPPSREGEGLQPSMQVFRLRKSRQTTGFGAAVTLGRASSNDVTIQHPSVSKLHARVTITGEQLTISDAGSSNGTSVAGTVLPAGEERDLPDGSELQLGHVWVTCFSTERFLELLARKPTR